jgi:hypothetical protein
MANTTLAQTRADLNGKSVAIISGTPVAGQIASFVTDDTVQGIAVPSGSVVVQVVNGQTGAVATGTTNIPLDDTIPQNTEGDQYMSLAITPTSATHKLKIDVVFNGSVSVAEWIIVALFQDSTANALAVAPPYLSTGTGIATVTFSYYMTAGTTSATTFKVRAGKVSSGTMTFNGFSGARKFGGAIASSITITELTA